MHVLTLFFFYKKKLEKCSLAKETGDCTGKHARWSFDKTENKCMPFYFTGCKGNDNSFVSFEECENNCPKKIGKFFEIIIFFSLFVVV